MANGKEEFKKINDEIVSIWLKGYENLKSVKQAAYAVHSKYGEMKKICENKYKEYEKAKDIINATEYRLILNTIKQKMEKFSDFMQQIDAALPSLTTPEDITS